MRFNGHSNLVGKHAFLSASRWHWINYDEEKLTDAYYNHQNIQRGTELHALAHQLVRLNVPLPRDNKTLNAYVNDAIGYRMSTEQVLYYSDNCYGTADAICFDELILRIHDFKSGVNEGSFNQLLIYAALFCLEYGVRPGEIEIELRIYQNDEIKIMTPDLHDVVRVISKIIAYDRLIDDIKEGGSVD